MKRQKTDKLLAAIDLQDDTESVLAYALWLAKNSGTAYNMELLYVLDYGFTPPSYLTPYIEKEKSVEEKKIQGWEDRLKASGVSTHHIITMGRLTETFNKTVKETGADIVVIGHKSHIVRPSSSERLIKSLDVPMLVVRGKKSANASLDGLGIKRILCAVDFSDNSKKAFEYAQALSAAGSSELVLAHAVPSMKIENGLRKWPDMSETEKNRAMGDIVKEAEDKTCSFLGGCRGAGTVVRTGIPYEVINSIAEEKDIDLIVMGARGLSYIKGIMLGSVSESVLKSSPCPVMIIHQ